MNPDITDVKDILEELNLENGSNYKIDVLKKYQTNENLKRLLKMTYDKVSYTYGITMKNVPEIENYSGKISLMYALTVLEQDFATRNVTGNKAIELLTKTLKELSKEDAEVLAKVLDRDLRINIGRTNINKVFKNLIVKPPYTRCSIGTKENIQKNIDFSRTVYSQEKMDGTFRRALIDGENIEITSRPGIVTEFPLIEKQLKSLNVDGYVLIGEMTLKGEKDRKKGNGLINSLKIPHEDVIYTVWDMIPAIEFSKTKAEIKELEKEGMLSLYETRFNKLKDILTSANLENVKLIECKIVKSMREAYEHFQEITKAGGEGTVIKAHDMTHKDGDSKKQLKVKLEIALDMIITGFTEGTGKNKAYFGAITFENHEGTIKGKVGVSSMTEKMRNKIHTHRDEYIGKIMEVHCNDITKSKDHDYYALSHPRFERIRSKNETDTLERALELKEMAMELK